MARTGILLVNVGTPKSTDPEDVGDYLREFLMDPEVINLPWPLRAFLVKILIVPKRKFASAEKYKKIWTTKGSPLLVHLKGLADGLAQEFRREDVEVKIAMRYGLPSIQEALVEWKASPPQQILVAPLYPQYADASHKTAIDAVTQIFNQMKIRSRLNFLPSFYDDQYFISSLAKVARSSLPFEPDHFLFSYHGLPKNQVMRHDSTSSWCNKNKNCCVVMRQENQNCYRAQCYATSRALAEELHLSPSQWSVSFQSRLGPTPWIEPYTDHVLPTLAKAGVKRLAVMCPSFVADCLETLEEIGIEGRRTFLSNGGQDFALIPCLNSEAVWIKAFAEMLRVQLS